MSDYDPRAYGARCDLCPLEGSIVVPPEPPRGKLRLIVVGEGPGRYEEKLRRPFVGPSGRLLDAALKEAGGARRDCYVTNAMLCRAEDERDIEAAICCCAPRLAAELQVLPKETPILSLGAAPARVTIGKKGIQKYRGFIWTAPEVKPTSIRAAERAIEKIGETKVWKNKRQSREKTLAKRRWALELLKARAAIAGRTVIPTVHPAFILRGADVWTPILRIDMKRALMWPFKLESDIEFTRTTSPAKARRLLAKMGPLINVDLETDGNDPMRVKFTCVGVADVNALGQKERVVILDPWSDSLAPILKEAIEKRTILTHNGPAFDVVALAERFGIKPKGIEDTLVAHRTFASHMPQSLAHVASVYCAVIPWKVKFKQGEEKGAVAGFGVKKEDLAAYNAIDVVAGSLCWKRMQPDLKPHERLYREDMAMAALYTEMQRTGLRVDVARQRQLSSKLQRRAAALLGEMRELLRRRHFDPAKPDDVRKALYKQLKAPLWLAPPTPTGLPSTSVLVLEALKHEDNRAGRLADLIMRWRSANDSRSEYLDVYVHTDGRIHPTWKQVETGRPATRRPNILNIPTIDHCRSCGVKLLDGCSHGRRVKVDGVEVFQKCKRPQEPQPEAQLRDIYVAAKGHQLVYFDLSQAEMRMAAHCSGDPVFIESCGKDIHTENACILFPDGAEMIRADPKGAGNTFRQIAKICGFAVCYGAEAAKLLATLRADGKDVDIDDVEAMLAHLKTAYKVYYNYVAANLDFCQKHGYLVIPFSGRYRWFGFYPKPTAISNTPIQGGVAGVMNKALLELERRKTRNAKLIMYHYDAAIYELPAREAADMDRIIAEFWSKPLVVPHNGLSFVQKIDQKRGERMSDF